MVKTPGEREEKEEEVWVVRVFFFLFLGGFVLGEGGSSFRERKCSIVCPFVV